MVSAPTSYRAGRWVHVAAVFNGYIMRLYVDGSKVGTGHDQRGPLFNSLSSACKELLIGGDYITKHLFRGSIDELRLWNTARTHTEIRSSLHHSMPNDLPLDLVFHESFADLSQWETTLALVPVIIPSTITQDRHDIELSPAPCGVTICDDPDIVRSYGSADSLKTEKSVRYQIINVLADDGTNPTVTQEQIETQHEVLNSAFHAYNISWVRSVVEVRNSSLRQRTILLHCRPEKVGNGMCNPECRHERTGNDGGDCDEVATLCEIDNIGNGVCDSSCNRMTHSWDGGDCCDPVRTEVSHTCFDPASPYRYYKKTA